MIREPHFQNERELLSLHGWSKCHLPVTSNPQFPMEAQHILISGQRENQRQQDVSYVSMLVNGDRWATDLELLRLRDTQHLLTVGCKETSVTSISQAMCRQPALSPTHPTIHLTLCWSLNKPHISIGFPGLCGSPALKHSLCSCVKLNNNIIIYHVLKNFCLYIIVNYYIVLRHYIVWPLYSIKYIHYHFINIITSNKLHNIYSIITCNL